MLDVKADGVKGEDQGNCSAWVEVGIRAERDKWRKYVRGFNQLRQGMKSHLDWYVLVIFPV